MSRGYFGLSILLALAPLACAKHDALQPPSAPAFAGPNTAGAGGATGTAGAAEAPPTEPVPPPARTRTEVRSGASAAAGSAAAAGSTATAGTTAIPEAGAGTGGTAGSTGSAGTSSNGREEPNRSGFCGDFPVELLEVPEAGTGTISGCAPRTCTSPKLPSRDPEITAIMRPDATALPLSSFAGCTTIDGDLLVNRAAGDDLSALHCLERVNGTILIWYHPTLASLDGLESLALVEGDLLISGPFYNLYAPNNVLTRVDALQQLRAVRGTLAIEGSALTSLHGLEGVRATGGSLKIGIVRGLRDLRGLGSIAAVGDDLDLGRPEGLLSLAGLDSLTTIAGGFWLSGGIDLLSVGGLPELKCVAGNFDFAGSEYAYTNDRLRTADGFPKLQSIGGSVWLGPHPMLQTASLLGAVQFIGGDLDVRGSPQLSALDLSALEHAGRISVTDNPALDECAVHAVVDPLVDQGLARLSLIEGNRACASPFSCTAGVCGF